MPEYMVSIKIEKLEEGAYLATSDALPGLVAEGRTIAETMEIAQNVARKIIESYIDHGDPLPPEMAPASDTVRNITSLNVDSDHLREDYYSNQR